MSESAPDTRDECISLIADGEIYWLFEGEKYLSAMLADEGYYPTPIICYSYGSRFDLMKDLDEDVILNALWAIHPGIIDRLKKADKFIERRK